MGSTSAAGPHVSSGLPRRDREDRGTAANPCARPDPAGDLRLLGAGRYRDRRRSSEALCHGVGELSHVAESTLCNLPDPPRCGIVEEISTNQEIGFQDSSWPMITKSKRLHERVWNSSTMAMLSDWAPVPP